VSSAGQRDSKNVSMKRLFLQPGTAARMPQPIIRWYKRCNFPESVARVFTSTPVTLLPLPLLSASCCRCCAQHADFEIALQLCNGLTDIVHINTLTDLADSLS
jgi:hypothetical protein